jgi:transposase-like protein
MTKNRYSREFESQALVKVRERADKSVGTIAQELGMSEGTLRKWVTNANRKERAATPEAALPIDVAASAWSAAQRLLALQETHALSGPELHAWCRQRGLFAHQLSAWREAFCASAPTQPRDSKAALRELQVKCDKLQRELTRKERALAETAALLVLQKKYQSLWEGEEK